MGGLKNAKWPSGPCRPRQKTQNGLPGPAGLAKKRKMAFQAPPARPKNVKLPFGPSGTARKANLANFFFDSWKSWAQLFFQLSKKKLASQGPRGLGRRAGRPPGRSLLAGQAGLARLGWPGQAGLARMTSHRALWPDRRENARGYPQNAWFPINKQASMLKIDDFLSKILTVLSKSMHSGQKWWQYRRNQGFVFKSHHSMVTNWFTIKDVCKKYKSISETDALCSNTMIAWSTAMILLKNHNLMAVFEE